MAAQEQENANEHEPPSVGKALWEYNQNLLFQKYYNSHLFKWDQGITLFLISTEVEEGIELDYSKR